MGAQPAAAQITGSHKAHRRSRMLNVQSSGAAARGGQDFDATRVRRMIAISQAEFDQAVSDALRGIPAEFQPYLENVLIEVLPRPTPKMMRDYDIPDDALGYYMGTPLAERSIDASAALPDRILIFREPLTEMCESREELIDEIRITVLHEVGHHFGLDEDQLEHLGYD